MRSTSGVYDFAEFSLDVRRRRLLRDGRAVSLPPKAFDLLVDLVEHAGHLREKKQLMDALWPGTSVDEASLAYAASALRKALADGRSECRYVETLPTRGYRFVGDVRGDVNGGAALPVPIDGARVPAPRARRVPRTRWAQAAGLIAALAVGAAAGRWLLPADPDTPAQAGATVRGSLQLALPLVAGTPPGSTVHYDAPRIAISPDERRVAYVGRVDDTSVLLVGELEEGTFHVVPGTRGAFHPFFSPDGRSIGYLTNQQLKRVALDGSQPVTVCDVTAPIVGAWFEDTIYVSALYGHVLLRVPARGGTPLELKPPREPWWFFSDVLPGGRWALVHTSTTQNGGADIAALDIVTGEMRYLLAASFAPRYAAGRLFFASAGALMSVPFDPKTAAVTGTPSIVAADVMMDSLTNAVQVAASEHVLVYVPGADRAVGRLASVGRDGQVEDLEVPSRRYVSVQLDPRGVRIAASVADVHGYVWVYDLARREGRRLAAAEPATFPVWSPDGREMAYTVFPDPPREKAPWPELQGFVTFLPVDGAPGPGRRTKAEQFGEAWSPDGRTLVAHMLSAVDVATGETRRIVPEDQFHRTSAYFAPSGRFLAYASNETGRFEVWVRSWPNGAIVRQISTEGGLEPVWTRSGELFYRAGDTWYVTRVTEAPTLAWEKPVIAFTGEFQRYHGRSYAVSPDGRRMYVLRSDVRSVPTTMGVVTNWRARR
jgi:serine/threonine-protein kinase